MLSGKHESAIMLAMKSPFLVLLLVASVLTCPLRCLSCSANVADGEVSASPACSCCSHCEDSPNSDLPPSDAPSPREDDCHCQACICEGAVVEAEVEQLSQRLDSKPMFGSAAPIMATRAIAGHDAARHLEFLMRCSLASPWQILCGRDARIAHQSWLI
jgi:hypothetical protein